MTSSSRALSSLPSMCGVLLERFLPSASALSSLTLSSHARPNPLLTPLPPADVVVRVVSAGINASDVKNALGQMPHTRLPLIIGRDYSGVVVSTGADCQQWQGRAVYGTGGDLGFLRDGAHAEYLQLPASALAAKPQRLTFAQAACVGVNFVTAYMGLHLVGKLTAADVVLVTGASGGVGTAVRQLAKIAGAAVITVDRSKGRHSEPHTAQTADYSLFLSELARGFDDLPAAVSALPIFASQPEDAHSVSSFSASTHSFTAAGRGPSLIFDVLGGSTLAPLLRCLASNGRLVNIATAAHEDVSFDLHDLYRRQLQIRGANSLFLSCSDSADILNQLTPLFDSGQLTPMPIASTVDVRQAVDADGANAVGQAYDSVHKGAKGKVLLNFDMDAADKL